MSTIDMRTESQQILERIDERFLAAVYALLRTYDEPSQEPIVGYEIDGTPVTASRFLQQADEAMAAVDRGEYTTIEELEEESKKWLERTR
ncbi:MAG: hypothetical protein AAGA62_15755 [Bacteroidota bacterium]